MASTNQQSKFSCTYKRINPTTVKAILSLIEACSNILIPIVVLDLSGSMAGARLNRCLDAIRYLLTKIPKIHLIGYHSQAVNYGVGSSFPRIEAGGTTSFYAAYEMILQVIKNAKTPQCVIFMTDGENTDGRDISRDRARFKQQLVGTNCVIHTIGIESESHTQHMLDLSRCGSADGTYGYFSHAIANSYQLEMDRLTSHLGGLTEVEFRGQKYFLGEESLAVYFEDTEMNCGVPDAIDEIDYLAYRANELIRQGGAATLKDIQVLREHSQNIFKEAGRQPRILRKRLRERLDPIYTLINEFYQLIHSKQVISHEKLALLNVAARDARSNRFVKKAVDRTDQNLAIIEREDNDLITITAELANVKLDDQPEEFTCMLSCLSPAELLRDGDCLGIGINATAREVCIVDPTLLQINQVSTSFFGCDTFLDAGRYSVRNTPVAYGDNTNIVLDSSRAPVSGVLPLYLNPTHWKVAKLYLRRMAGHLCCKDPMLGSNRTTFYTYLNVYHYCLSQPGSFHAQISDLVRETLVKIYEMMPSIIPSPQEFCGDIAKRMPDVVPSVPLLLTAYAALFLFRPATECLIPSSLACYVWEEERRREKPVLSLNAVCEIDEQHWVRPYVIANTPKGSTSVCNRLLTFISQKHPSAVEAFLRTIGTVSDSNAAAANPVEVPDVESYSPLIRLPLWIEDTFNDLSLERRALIALQLTELSGMTECIQKYRDLFTLGEDNIKTLLQRRCEEHIKQRRASELTSVITAMQQRNTYNLTGRLRNGVSLLERVAIMHDVCYIGRNIMHFYDTVTNFEELKMLVTGEYDIAPLIGHPTAVVVPTVMDMNAISNTLPQMEKDSPVLVYKRRWLPSMWRMRRLKNLCLTYGREKMMSLIPEAEYIINRYCE